MQWYCFVLDTGEVIREGRLSQNTHSIGAFMRCDVFVQ